MASLKVVVPLGLLFLAASCSHEPRTTDRRAVEARTIRDGEATWNRDFVRSDLEGLMSHYAVDATVSLPMTTPAGGAEAIRDLWKAAIQDGNFSMRLESVSTDVALSGDLAYSAGTYTGSMTDPATAARMRDTGTFVVVYRKGPDGRWKVVLHTQTRSRPPVAEE